MDWGSIKWICLSAKIWERKRKEKFETVKQEEDLNYMQVSVELLYNGNANN